MSDGIEFAMDFCTLEMGGRRSFDELLNTLRAAELLIAEVSYISRMRPSFRGEILTRETDSRSGSSATE